MPKTIWSVVLICLIGSSLAAQTSDDGLQPVPKALEQGKVDRPLREKYRKEFSSREPADRVTLAHTLRDEADQQSDLTARFVLLREARDLSVSAGDMVYAMDVIDDMARTYAINPAEMKAGALSLGVDDSRAAPADLAASYIKVADDALATWNLDLAHKAAYMAHKVAAGNRPLQLQADARDKTARLRNHELVEVLRAERKLDSDPDDPGANLIVGRHLCFNTNHWETGLAYLAKSPPGPLKTLARRELAVTSDPKDMAQLADAYWQLSDSAASLTPGSAHRRAAYWYSKAIDGLTGKDKSIAQDRVAQATAPRSE